MLLPQFSLRLLLIVLTCCAAISLVLASAVQGSSWAIAVSMGVLLLAIVLITHAFVFWLVWLFSIIAARWQSSAGDMPATANLREQESIAKS